MDGCRWSLEWAAPTRTQPCTDFGYKDFCGSTALGTPESVGMNRPELHSSDRLKERGMEKESGRHSTLQGRERSVFNLTNIGIISRATLGRLLRDGLERVWAFPSDTMPS